MLLSLTETAEVFEKTAGLSGALFGSRRGAAWGGFLGGYGALAGPVGGGLGAGLAARSGGRGALARVKGSRAGWGGALFGPIGGAIGGYHGRRELTGLGAGLLAGGVAVGTGGALYAATRDNKR